MSRVSERFYRHSTRLFTFSGIAFCLKIIPLKAVTISDVNIELENLAIARGILISLTVYLLLLCIITAVKDTYRQKILDEKALSESGKELPPIILNEEAKYRNFSHHEFYLRFSFIELIFEIFFPLLFGVSVVIICLSDLVIFLEHLACVVTLEFTASDPAP